MKRLIAVILGVALLASTAALLLGQASSEGTQAEAQAPTPTVPPKPKPKPKKHWQLRNCPHGHPSKVSYKVVARTLRNHHPVAAEKTKKLGHYARCVATAKKARAVHRFIRDSWAWRKQYEHYWPIRFHSLAPWLQSWAVSTSQCEAGGNPATATGNGFYGAFQFLQSTWQMAGGSGVPHQHSWHYQAVIAVNWMLRTSDEQWPVCGD